MEFLLKEALKTLCGTNQWSYAVFWSISRQNPNNPFGECTPLSIQAEERVHPLINKLMLKKINVAGEGVVGQAAFSGNHQWILAGSYITDSHPPEVQDEIYQQISAGMQTVAVIPVLPHVVVQLGSPFAIMENMGFVNNVKTLIRSLGGAPDALPYESDATKDHAELFQNSGLVGQLSHSLTEEIKNGPHATASPFQYPDQTWNLSKSEKEFFIPNFTHVMEPECTFEGHIKYGDIGTDMVLSKPNVWQNQLSTSSGLNFHPEFGQENAGYDGQKSIECQIFSGINDSQMELAPTEPNIDEDLSQALTYPEGLVSLSDNIPSFSNEYQNHDNKIESPGCPNVKHLETLPQPSSGDLFDILGVEYKSNLFGKRNNLLATVPDDNTWNSGAVSSKDNVDLCHIYSMSEGISHSGIFSMTDSDHLLDAVVSNGHSAAKQGPDDNNSCMTTLRKINRNPIVTGPSTYGHDSASDYLKSGSLGLPKPLHKAGSLDTGCFRSGFTKDSVSSCSQTTVHGSQISSLVERGTYIKPDTSMSTTYCKRSDEMNKSTRKRLKAGENPRPRPKDRQMIQDRLKELREIVPNGGKCPIDALLERTVKHMCFLQNVTKHADKLKQSRESKLINKQGGQFLKYNFEGGATWGLEVGSQSMVCPIIVEDLSPPRQLLVEMLCEERGFFLEIADFIRGLGLTILKGVMETRNDKIWAQFAVEANRDVTRMEIFMALVPLLEEKTRGNGSLAKTVDSSLMMMHKSFTRATPIPATGRPH